MGQTSTCLQKNSKEDRIHLIKSGSTKTRLTETSQVRNRVERCANILALHGYMVHLRTIRYSEGLPPYTIPVIGIQSAKMTKQTLQTLIEDLLGEQARGLRFELIIPSPSLLSSPPSTPVYPSKMMKSSSFIEVRYLSALRQQNSFLNLGQQKGANLSPF